MAYLKDITARCQCGARAVVQLVNFQNAPMGRYCKPCGARALRTANANEQAQFARERAAGEPPC